MQADFAGTSLGALSWILNAYNIVFAAFLVAAGRLADLARPAADVPRRRRALHARLGRVRRGADRRAARRRARAAGARRGDHRARLARARAPRLPARASARTASRCGPPAPRSPPGSGRRSAARSSSSAAGGSPSSSTSRSGIAAYVAGRRTLVESRAPGRRTLPDLAGAGLAALAIGALTLGIVQGEEWGWTSPPVLAAFAAAPLLRRRVRAPLPPAPRRRCSTSTCCGSARCRSRTC